MYIASRLKVKFCSFFPEAFGSTALLIKGTEFFISNNHDRNLASVKMGGRQEVAEREEIMQLTHGITFSCFMIYYL